MSWEIVPTATFDRMCKKYRRDRAFAEALRKKIQRLQANPFSVGGSLAGELSGKRSTRLVGKCRLVFQIVESERAVYLLGLDHRKQDYKRS